MVTFHVDSSYTVGRSVALQPDEKIIVTGDVTNHLTGHTFLLRYQANATLDSSFGSKGRVFTDIGTALDLSANGKIIVAGSKRKDFALAQYTSDGTLDNGFGINGIVTTDISNSKDYGYSVAVQPNGKIVLAGGSNLGREAYYHIGIARYNVDTLMAVNEQDSLALVALYNATNGPSWIQQENWLTKQPVSTWYGIIVDGNRVFSISLPNNKLLGSIPPEIGNLSRLSVLFLYNNQLNSLPPEIGSLVNLANLVLFSNQLSSLPPEIGNLVNLSRLDLSFNQLSNLPPEIGNLSKLSGLYLDNNQLSNLPPEIGNPNNLYYLRLNNNHLTFDGLELIIPKLLYGASYSPQANIPLHQNINALSVYAGGTLSNNTYNWYKVEDSSYTTITGDSVFHPSSSGKYYAAVTNSICTQLTLYTDTIEYDAALPVTLINLKAQQQSGIVKVEWTSLTEINVDKYEIQRASNAQNFVGIGSLPATGNGTQRISYTFNDVKPLQGNNYYRLKAFDKDRVVTYSKMVLVKMNSDKTITLIYPNPAKYILNIQAIGSASFSLMNQSGETVLAKTINNSGAMDISHFAAGLYYLKNSNTGEVQKIIVTK